MQMYAPGSESIVEENVCVKPALNRAEEAEIPGTAKGVLVSLGRVSPPPLSKICTRLCVHTLCSALAGLCRIQTLKATLHVTCVPAAFWQGLSAAALMPQGSRLYGQCPPHYPGIYSALHTLFCSLLFII